MLQAMVLATTLGNVLSIEVYYVILVYDVASLCYNAALCDPRFRAQVQRLRAALPRAAEACLCGAVCGDGGRAPRRSDAPSRETAATAVIQRAYRAAALRQLVSSKRGPRATTGTAASAAPVPTAKLTLTVAYSQVGDAESRASSGGILPASRHSCAGRYFPTLATLWKNRAVMGLGLLGFHHEDYSEALYRCRGAQTELPGALDTLRRVRPSTSSAAKPINAAADALKEDKDVELGDPAANTKWRIARAFVRAATVPGLPDDESACYDFVASVVGQAATTTTYLAAAPVLFFGPMREHSRLGMLLDADGFWVRVRTAARAAVNCEPERVTSAVNSDRYCVRSVALHGRLPSPLLLPCTAL